MHFFKTTTQVFTLFALSTMALPTRCNIAITQNPRAIVSRSDTPQKNNLDNSTGQNNNKKHAIWKCSCQAEFPNSDAYNKHWDSVHGPKGSDPKVLKQCALDPHP
ncbi:uncharacterized protein PpBr36_10214 [Pyricularia pennisetigena]|uniref:uncharacterized protein n=1 Tax=Pyricularia pennisetigena TaxID=1578925 RepID=UPI00114F0045|nr:uncharacterized protein PpBr36_10214 [Pyricularia pennisetigena]TLS21523.1 hypothetical protein PpBr36_10214 [Pyricularia pennisetigena]